MPAPNQEKVIEEVRRRSTKKKADIEQPMNLPEIKMKKILFNLNGFVKPKEMVALMGSSGSGKTSLLNVLAQRLTLSPGARVTGEVKVNGRVVNATDFGKFGCFVQQDDILIAVMTARESLRFACKLRTSLTGEEVEDRIDLVVEKLSLHKCQNTFIGGQMMKGLSGGERKRVSIGYEMITDPQLLLLDEPTSGLDSFTAYNLMAMLKRQANAGMTIIATIHSPSNDLFNLFDRLILLNDGWQIYQGPVNQLPDYLRNMNLKLKQFQSLSDTIIKLSISPGSY